MIHIKQINSHKRDCHCKRKNYLWTWVAQRVYWGTIAGKEGGSRAYYRWLELICNDPDCRAKAIISEKYICKIIKSRFGKLRIRWSL